MCTDQNAGEIMENSMALDDFFDCMRVKSQTILKVSLVTAFLMTLYMLTRPVLFQAEATFRERKSSSENDAQLALKWLQLGDDTSSNEAISWFKSHTARQALVKKFDLNGEIKGVRWFSFPTLLAIKEHLVADWARFWNKQSPSLPRHLEAIEVKNVRSSLDAPLALTIYPDSKEEYQVYLKGNFLGKGRFSEEFNKDSFQFTLVKTDQPLLKKYELTLWPVETRATQLKNFITAKSTSKDPSLVLLTFSERDRFLAKEYLNGLMELYRQYLKSCHAKVIQAQVSYLEKRQEEMSDLLDHTLMEHVLAAREDLAHSGFVSSEKAFSFLAQGVQKQKERLFQIDLEIKRLKERGPLEVLFADEKNLNPLFGEIRSLKQMKESLKAQLGEGAEKGVLSEYRGLTLSSAQEFYLNLCRDLKELKGREKLILHVLEELKSEVFEISSLSSVLKDPVGQKLIERASVIRQALNDEGNRTSGELVRLEKERLQIKGFLKSHLEQTFSLIELEQKEVFKKIEEVQQVSYFLVKEEITLLEKQVEEAIFSKISELEQEKRLLLNQNIALNKELERVPSQWLSEKKLERHLAQNEKMTADLGRLVETKNMTTHLEVVTAEPQDLAIAPLHPKSVHLILVPLFGAFLGAGGAIGALFWQGAQGNLPIGKQTLLLKGMKVIEKEELCFERLEGSCLLLQNGEEFEDLSGFVPLSTTAIKSYLSEKQKSPLVSIDLTLKSKEAKALARVFDTVIIVLRDETMRDLTPYFLMRKSFIFIFSTKGDVLC